MTLTQEREGEKYNVGSFRVSTTSQKPLVHRHNDDLSTFSKVLVLYTRDRETGDLYCIEQNYKFLKTSQWKNFFNIYKSLPTTHSTITDTVTEYIVPEVIVQKFNQNLQLDIKISEYIKPNEKQIRGCITTVENESKFNDWFIFHILDQSRLSKDYTPLYKTSVKYDELFTDYFANSLKNTIVGDKWNEGGRDHFISKVRYFTDRYIRIECVLPAFPCKSSNVEKVGGDVPDKGEEFALKRLIQATQEVQKFYPPGMKVWIISDGHVFSDCIGVDDDIVNSYTCKLHQLYERLAIPGHDAIGFCGLNTLFFDGITAPKFDPKWVSEVKVEHYTGSKICALSDLSRQVLLRGCDTDAGQLKKEIAIDGHPRLYLYRGFSKFMSEDLRLLPYFKDMSRKKFKKTVSKIAFNMIKRNDAYSNLVELAFPHHLRLSIHAHTNGGPKFGIKVISPEQCRIVKSLNDSSEPKSEDLLHIPTPWHNCVVKLTDQDDSYYLTKASVVKDALEKGVYEGTWYETCLEKGEGGHYILNKVKKQCEHLN
ncbi:hypothetical protein TBLA_0A02470 [Henningerozyma blattae CBS 6284]|uniref:Spore wall maturation protein DIT1 n=1 Tax=Henningerozyma blattae (strain ATCC 34711 / CBS 6284 / DSM 70876 / NBRC 10599 / NRRL Y-10934 / UCD 77-7) TaxID=1071380 RepID=I2GV94_HENB6|nr:hypothetical protein TBLA_0A02470 [Tetrapisispora blattae CBS 6284]CCH58046.1 hypothetical protein TBLA_0A02470 [Tetrapisispora blattae CBS 6284]